MKKFIMVFVLGMLGAAAFAQDNTGAAMQFVTVFSQPVGSFQGIIVTEKVPVQAEKINFGPNVTLNLSKGALFYRVNGESFFSNAEKVYVGSAAIKGGMWDASKVTINEFEAHDNSQVIISVNKFASSDLNPSLNVKGTAVTPALKVSLNMLKFGTSQFVDSFSNGWISTNPTCSWKPDLSSAGNLLLECS